MSVGRTESCSGFPDISFMESVVVEFYFEQPTRIRFEVHRLGLIPNVGTLVGVCECLVAQCVSYRGSGCVMSLEEPTFLGEPSGSKSLVVPKLEVFAEEAGQVHNLVAMDVEIALSSSGFSGQYFIELHRGSQLVYRSSPAHAKSGRIGFKNIETSSEKLCRGDIWLPIELCLNLSGPKKSRPLGSCMLVYFDLERVHSRREAGKQLLLLLRSKDDKIHGFASISVKNMVERFSFIDYVTAGLDINVLIGIDFTRSNGDPRAKGSLHGYTKNGPCESNEYVQVIRQVVGILQEYDSDKRYPVFGFGAKLPPSCSRVSHCFALNGDFVHPEVNGIDGILGAYREALGVVSLHGPTRFSELLRTTREWAEPLESDDAPKYLILLIITDGSMEAEDFQATVDEIVHLGNLPVSIVIVGVGNSSDFSQLVVLDADVDPLVSSVTGDKMARDIVQFVPFRDLKRQGISSVAAACLEELPQQVTEYFAMKKVFPKRAAFSDSGKRKYNGFTSTGRYHNTASAFSIGTPSFLDDKRSDLLVLMQNQGYDETAVSRVLNDPGFMCPDPLHVLDLMFHLKKFSQSDTMELGNQTLAEKYHVKDILDESDQAIEPGSSKGKFGVCRVCFTQPIDVGIKPCGHTVICRSCSSSIGKLCPLCRETISGISPV